MVAGVAAATADNGIGIAGVVPDARLMPVRVVTGLEGGTPEERERVNKVFAKGIRWAADHNADVINISSTLMIATDYPGGGLEEALAYAWDKGSVIVAASGNNLLSLCDYPQTIRTSYALALPTGWASPRSIRISP